MEAATEYKYKKYIVQAIHSGVGTKSVDDEKLDAVSVLSVANGATVELAVKLSATAAAFLAKLVEPHWRFGSRM